MERNNRKCPVCGKKIETPDAKYCSAACASVSRASRIITKKCVVCGKEYSYPFRENKKACSEACKKILLSGKERRVCIICGKEFLVYAKDPQKTCSAICARKDPSLIETKICVVCGKEFTAYPGQQKTICSNECRRKRIVTKKCPVCRKPITDSRSTYCSYKCAGKARQNYRKCVVCGKEFATPPSSPKVTCSPACSHQHRSEYHKKPEHLSITTKMREAHNKKYAALPPEEYPNAKSWIIKSPAGIVYECRNLLNWCREHRDLYEGTPKQAWDGLSKIKYSMQGKRKNPSSSWKGWTLIDFGE